MVDVLTKKQRSLNMSRIKSENTGPELIFKKFLSSVGIKNFIMYPKDIFGKPDFYFPNEKLVIFIDGCFWHKCPSCFSRPETNKKFWLNKINNNLKRDQKVNKVLRKEDFAVIRFWEHEIKRNSQECLNFLKERLKKINMKNKKPLKVLDLFSGGGGLSEGFWRSGVDFIAHIEMDKSSCKTLETRALYYLLLKKGKIDEYYKYLKGLKSKAELFLEYDKKRETRDSVINEKISKRSFKKIRKRIKEIMETRRIKNVDVIIGGPPCQTYSFVGRARMGKDIKNDERNILYRLYLEFVKYFKPKIFVFENVIGMKTAGKGKYLNDLKKRSEKLNYSIKKYDIDFSHFGVPQNRKRVLLIGINNRKVENTVFPKFKKKSCNVKINDFLKDLPAIKPDSQRIVMDYKKAFPPFLEKLCIRKKGFCILTDHIARKHCDRDLKIYRMAIKHLNNGKRLKYNELPSFLKTHKNTRSFLDRYKVIDKKARVAQTITAHISKDGHHYIHPDIKQNRSISVREAARLQTFPDDFKFEGSRTSKFRQIGNAVPPLFSYNIAQEIHNII